MREQLKIALREEWYPKSFTKQNNTNWTFKSWLSEGNTYIQDSDGSFSLYCNDVDEVRQCLSFDAFKFASHSAQTVFEIEKSTAYTKLTSWRIIQTYYAAFFAAHSILRLNGHSFSHLENGHVNHLRRRAISEASFTPSLPSNYYLMSFDEQSKLVTFNCYTKSHQHLWKCFLKLIEDLSKNALKARLSKEYREDVSNYLADLGHALTADGSAGDGNWLSTMRNEVNYKSFDGVWFPFSKNTPDFDSLMRQVQDWRKGGGKQLIPLRAHSRQLEQFFSTSFAVIQICFTMCADYIDILDTDTTAATAQFDRLLNESAA